MTLVQLLVLAVIAYAAWTYLRPRTIVPYNTVHLDDSNSTVKSFVGADGVPYSVRVLNQPVGVKTSAVVKNLPAGLPV